MALVLGATLAAAAAAADERRSGFDFMSAATQALQRDDTQNPAMLFVRDGQELYARPAGATGRSCADCHGDAARSMRGVAARYPAIDDASGRALNLAGRINTCRERHQRAAPLALESGLLLGLEAFVALASRGDAIAPPADPRLGALRERGRQLFAQRQGQLDLSCAICHDRHGGSRLGGSLIPQAHPTGYPIYRLEWQAMGSLQRRLRNCLAGVRAEVPPFGSDELLALEAYLMQRAAGMKVESPAVRP